MCWKYRRPNWPGRVKPAFSHSRLPSHLLREGGDNVTVLLTDHRSDSQKGHHTPSHLTTSVKRSFLLEVVRCGGKGILYGPLWLGFSFIESDLWSVRNTCDAQFFLPSLISGMGWLEWAEVEIYPSRGQLGCEVISQHIGLWLVYPEGRLCYENTVLLCISKWFHLPFLYHKSEEIFFCDICMGICWVPEVNLVIQQGFSHETVSLGF